MNRCPHCGFNLEQEKPVEDGLWRYTPRYGMTYDGKQLDTSFPVQEVMGSVMQARGGIVTREVLAERLGSSADNADKLISFYMVYGRKAAQRLGVPFPIKNVYGAGLRWDRAA